MLSKSAPSPSERSLVAIGGGSGLSVLLRGLKLCYRSPYEKIAAVVSVSDDGGSSGRLRRELGILPPGDIRNCLVALANDEDLLARLLQYRFPAGEGLTGHSFGNLFLAALADITGDFYQAIQATEAVLSVHGQILPATLSDVRLHAVGHSGRAYEGESAVGQSGERIRHLNLDPPDPAAFPTAVETLEQADMVVLGPGSLYTSILPNLLIPDIREALRRNSAPVVLILNLMTQPGETDGMNAIDHLDAIAEHAGADLVDVVLVNGTPLPTDQLTRYAEEGAEVVQIDREALTRRKVQIVEAVLLADGSLLRHDPVRLGRAVMTLVRNKL